MPSVGMKKTAYDKYSMPCPSPICIKVTVTRCAALLSYATGCCAKVQGSSSGLISRDFEGFKKFIGAKKRIIADSGKMFECNLLIANTMPQCVSRRHNHEPFEMKSIHRMASSGAKHRRIDFKRTVTQLINLANSAANVAEIINLRDSK